jgi:hypothetical protein
VERVRETEHFHDSESDIFDLFNAVDGVLDINGLLDVEQLNHYSPEEAKELNVPRLRVIWEHTATGCARCADIIRKLQILRRTLRENPVERGRGF